MRGKVSMALVLVTGIARPGRKRLRLSAVMVCIYWMYPIYLAAKHADIGSSELHFLGSNREALSFYSLYRQKHSVIGSVRPWVSACVRPENLVNTISHKPILVKDVFGFIDVMLSCWDQRSKVKVTAGNDLKKQDECNNSEIFKLISPKLSHACTRVRDILIRSKG